jgi:hypothetical protein
VNGQWASTVVWGANRHSGDRKWTHSGLAETEAILDVRNTILGRAELVQKSAEDLVLPTGPFAGDKTFNIGSLSAGYIREIVRRSGATLGFGALGSLNFVPRELEPFYDSRTPVGGMVFLRFRPIHSAHSMGGMNMSTHH